MATPNPSGPVVEVDGPIHQSRTGQDAARQRLSEDRGYIVLRLQATAVEKDVAAVVEDIATVVKARARELPDT